jgi:hypothetical protein
MDETIPFSGFPINTEGRVLGFTGGSVYKIRDANNTFLNCLARLLRQQPQLVILFAQIGADDFIRAFISDHHLEDRLILIGNRRDIYQVFSHIDFYINTYPYGGGNMIQYAAIVKKPILALADPRLPHTHLDIVLDCPALKPFQHFNEESFVNGGAELVNSREQRAHYGETLANCISNCKQFTNGLHAILTGEMNECPESVDFDLDNDYYFNVHARFEQFNIKKYFQHLRMFYGLKDAIKRQPRDLLSLLYYNFVN